MKILLGHCRISDVENTNATWWLSDQTAALLLEDSFIMSCKPSFHLCILILWQCNNFIDTVGGYMISRQDGWLRHICETLPTLDQYLPITKWWWSNHRPHQSNQTPGACPTNDISIIFRNFVHITTVILSWHVQNFVVLGWAHCKPEHCKFWLNFEFDQNTISEMGARLAASDSNETPPWTTPVPIPLAPYCPHAQTNCNKIQYQTCHLIFASLKKNKEKLIIDITGCI